MEDWLVSISESDKCDALAAVALISFTVNLIFVYSKKILRRKNAKIVQAHKSNTEYFLEKNKKLKKINKRQSKQLHKLNKILDKKNITQELPAEMKLTMSLTEIEEWNKLTPVQKYIFVNEKM